VHPWTSAVAAVVAAAAGGGQQHLLCLACFKVGLLTHQLTLHACGPGQQGGGAAMLALFGSHQGQAADAVACAARSRPRAKVGEGQRRSRVHHWTSVVVTAPAGGGEQHLLCSDCVRVGPPTHQLALRVAQGGRGGGSSACFAWLALGSGR
jgi:hypothetical protein